MRGVGFVIFLAVRRCVFWRFDLSVLAVLGLREVGMLGLEREGMMGGGV